MSFSKIFQILFIISSTFRFIFRSASIIHGGVSRRHSRILKTEEEFLFNLAPSSSRFVILASSHPLVIVLIVKILFTHPEIFKSLLSLIIRSPSIQIYSFSVCSYHSPILPVLRSRFLFLCYCIDPFVISILPVVR